VDLIFEKNNVYERTGHLILPNGQMSEVLSNNVHSYYVNAVGVKIVNTELILSLDII
jgi:hypothetical protein